MKCPNCQREWPEGAKFCGYCGHPLQELVPSGPSTQGVPSPPGGVAPPEAVRVPTRRGTPWILLAGVVGLGSASLVYWLLGGRGIQGLSLPFIGRSSPVLSHRPEAPTPTVATKAPPAVSEATQPPPLSPSPRLSAPPSCSRQANGGQVRILFRFNGEAANNLLGYSVSTAGDVNGDGVPDLIVGAPDSHDSRRPGRAYVFSGQDGRTLFTLYDGETGSRLGYSVSPAGDMNRDGIPDVLVSAPGHSRDNSRNVYVYSGRDGSRLLRISGSAYSGDIWDTFGFSVSAAGDVNGDGVPDIIVGAPYSDPGGRDAGVVYVFSGANGALLHRFEGQRAYAFMGSSVSTAGDIDGDGRADVIVGAPDVPTDYVLTGNPGSVYVFSGATGAQLFRLDGERPDDEFGWAVSTVGDVNGDGVPDFIVGIRPISTAGRPGRAYVFSGSDRRQLFRWDGESPEDLFGQAVAPAGDVNGDGKIDFIVGAPLADPGGRTNAGSIIVFSGIDGSLLFRFDGEAAEDRVGHSVSTAGDVNGDGRADVIVGAPYADPGGRTDAGSVYVLSFTPANRPPSTEDRPE